MHNEDVKGKFYSWQGKMLKGDEKTALIAKYEGKYFYFCKKSEVILDEIKIQVDKGNGFEDYFSFREKFVLDDAEISLMIKEKRKLIFKDKAEKFHAYGLKETETEFKKLIIYLKTDTVVMIVFASAEKNSVAVLQNFIEPENETISTCLFDDFSEKNMRFNPAKGGLYEKHTG